MTSQDLAAKQCKPCSGDTPPLKGDELKQYHGELGHDWELEREHHIHKSFKFPDFQAALDFVNKVGAIAEKEQHHPDILLKYGSVTITLLTHAIDGLSENDFILAAKIEKSI